MISAKEITKGIKILLQYSCVDPLQGGISLETIQDSNLKGATFAVRGAILCLAAQK